MSRKVSSSQSIKGVAEVCLSGVVTGVGDSILVRGVLTSYKQVQQHLCAFVAAYFASSCSTVLGYLTASVTARRATVVSFGRHQS